MDNPYEPPKPVVNETVSEKPPGESELASRWLRLAASLIDTFIGGGISMSITLLVLGYDLKALGTADLPTQAMLMVMGVTIFLVLHGYLLAKNGQTIGKLLLKIRIANLDGSKPDFLPLIAKRYLPQWLVAQIPIVGGFINLINICFIFRADKRCVHDLIAGTKVVKVL